jgi:hypothetical protein
MVADTLEYPDHFDEKRDHQGGTDKHNETGGKKGHDESERVFKPVGGYEQVNAEHKKESGYQYLQNPPQIFHMSDKRSSSVRW